MTLRILWLATKPPWPSRDGGRLVAAHTLEALARRGHRIVVLAPSRRAFPTPHPNITGRAVAVRAVPRAVTLAHSLGSRLPYSVLRHRHSSLGRTISQLLPAGFDVVHAEQLQALASWPRAAAHGPPVVLRMQNVESDLFAQAAALARGLRRRILCAQARSLAEVERRALRAVSAVCALSPEDTETLSALAGRPVAALPAPFPAELPASSREWPGDPALLLFGSAWLPNADAANWFVRTTWPPIRSRFPAARLHLVGQGAPLTRRAGIVSHPAPADSRDAFPEGAVQLVPLRIGSGVRMRILEAFARGAPVIATPVAARGLALTAGHELMVAETAGETCHALAALADPGARARLVSAGRGYLRREHDPDRSATGLEDLYRAAGDLSPGAQACFSGY